MKMKAEGIPQLVLRLALSIGFIIPVADRLGWMGPPGAPNVNWGDWEHFTGYAYQIMPALSRSLSDLFALGATIGEAICGLGLLVGYQTRWNAIGTALITLAFGLSMIASHGILAPIKYPVFVFFGGALLLACVKNPKWSVDNLLNPEE